MEKLAAGCEAGAEKAEVVSGSASLARLSSSYSSAVIFICNRQHLGDLAGDLAKDQVHDADLGSFFDYMNAGFVSRMTWSAPLHFGTKY